HRLGNSLAFTVEDTYNEHPITAGLLRRHTLWPLARPVSAVARPTPRPGALVWTAHELVTTSDRGFGETDLTALRTGRPEFTEKEDISGPVPVAAAAELSAAAGGQAPAEPAARARVVVIGSAQLAWNDSLVLFNRDLLVSAVQ